MKEIKKEKEMNSSPIAVSTPKQTIERVILQFSKKDIDAKTQRGLIRIDPKWRKGEFACEIATVTGICEGEKELKVGDKVAVSYLICFDEDFTSAAIKITNQANQYYISEDEKGNQTRWAWKNQVYCIIKKDKLIPLDGNAFCTPPELISERIQGGIILLGQKQETDKKAFKTKIQYISENNKKELGLHEGDEVLTSKDTDIEIEINATKFIRVPVHKILMKV